MAGAVQAGGMLDEEAGSNAEPFVPHAAKANIAYSVVRNFLGSVILFPLLVFLPLTLIAGAWYANEFVKRLRFRLDGEYFFVRQGVVLYNYTLIPYENVQDIHVTQLFTDQLLGMWTVIVFTATVGGGAVRIPFLSRESAESLKGALFARMKEARNVTD